VTKSGKRNLKWDIELLALQNAHLKHLSKKQTAFNLVYK